MFGWDFWIILIVVAIAGEINNHRIYSRINELEKLMEKQGENIRFLLPTRITSLTPLDNPQRYWERIENHLQEDDQKRSIEASEKRLKALLEEPWPGEIT